MTAAATAGPVALLGGLEHRAGCEVIDRRLIEQSAGPRPSVLVVPVASSPTKRPATAELARRYWGRLGADVQVLMPQGSRENAFGLIEQAEIIVLTGGVPDRIHSALSGSALWQRILDRHRQGAALAGSSAGAIELFEWRFKLRPPRPFSLIRGLGPMRNFVSLPHYNAYGIHRWGARLARRFTHMGLLGIDERTGLVGRGSTFEVLGEGSVTVIRNGARTVHPAGSSLTLDFSSI